jgi:hypothetical protein
LRHVNAPGGLLKYRQPDIQDEREGEERLKFVVSRFKPLNRFVLNGILVYDEGVSGGNSSIKLVYECFKTDVTLKPFPVLIGVLVGLLLGLGLRRFLRRHLHC